VEGICRVVVKFLEAGPPGKKSISTLLRRAREQPMEARGFKNGPDRMMTNLSRLDSVAGRRRRPSPLGADATKEGPWRS